LIVKAQQLAEMDEIIEYKASASAERRKMICQIWSKRIRGCQRNLEVWQVKTLPFLPKRKIKH